MKNLSYVMWPRLEVVLIRICEGSFDTEHLSVVSPEKNIYVATTNQCSCEHT